MSGINVAEIVLFFILEILVGKHFFSKNFNQQNFCLILPDADY